MRNWLDLTDEFPLRFDVARMRAEVEYFESDQWLEHYDHGLSEDWRAILLNSRHGDTSGPEAQRPSWDFTDFKRTRHLEQLPYFRQLLERIKCPQGRVRILRLAPGCGIRAHRDVGAEVGCVAFGQVRLHVPITTNDRVTFHVGGEDIRMRVGRLYYANFSKTHYVRNDGAAPRIHLVLDLKVNEWLARCFPRPNLWERLEFVAARATWPAFWWLRQWRVRLARDFWSRYEGSRPQALLRRLRGKAPRAV